MDAFLEFNPRSTSQLILHGDYGVVSICLPAGRMLGICPQTLRCGRPEVARPHPSFQERHVVSTVGAEKLKQPQFAGFGNAPGNRSLAAHTVSETCLLFQN